jgi:hypothetical protein
MDPSFNSTSVLGYGTNIYVADYNNSTIYQYDIAGNLTTLASVSPINPGSMGIDQITGTLLVFPSFISGNPNLNGKIFTITTGVTPVVTSYTYSSTGSNTNLGSVRGNAYATSATTAFVADYDNHQISSVVLNNDNTYTVTLFAVLPLSVTNTNINGIASDGTYLYTVGNLGTGAGKFFQYLAAGPAGGTATQLTGGATSFTDIIYIASTPDPSINTPSYYVSDYLNNQISVYTLSLSTMSLQASFTTTNDPNMRLPLALSFSQTGGTGILRFYFLNQPLSATRPVVAKLFLTNGGSQTGGDPHVTPIFGKIYDLPNDDGTFVRMLDTGKNNKQIDRICINAKLSKMRPNLLEKYSTFSDYYLNSTFLDKITILILKNSSNIANHSTSNYSMDPLISNYLTIDTINLDIDEKYFNGQNQDKNITIESIEGTINEITNELESEQACRNIKIRQYDQDNKEKCIREINVKFLRVNMADINRVLINVKDSNGLDEYWGANVKQKPMNDLIVKSLYDTL